MAPPTFTGQTQIEVVHCVQQYIIPASQPNSATDPLQRHMVVFWGEMAHGQLPMIMLESALGLPNFFIAQPTTVPNNNSMVTFYQTHGHQELVTSQTLAINLTQHMVQYLTFLPIPFVPAFIDRMHPKAALNQAKKYYCYYQPPTGYSLNTSSPTYGRHARKMPGSMQQVK
jgi:hypothetical protein